MNTVELSNFLASGWLKDVPVERPGPIYATLCEAFPLSKIKNKKQHASALMVLTKLSECLQSKERAVPQEKRQILDYLDALGLLVEEYEKKTFAADLDLISGAEMVEFLMEQHSLKQKDLARELGGQSIVSEILSRKRRLSSHQILALSKRFGVSPSVFFP